MTASAILAPVKTCTKCGQCKPHTDFYKSAAARDGFYPFCKACDKARIRAKKLSPEKIAALDKYEQLHSLGKKQCNSCQEVKDHQEFHVRTDRNNEVCSKCKICQTLHRTKKYHESPEKNKALAKARYAANAEEQKAIKKAEYWADPAKHALKNKLYREKYGDAIRAGSRAWYQANKEHCKAVGKAHYNANKQLYIEGNRRRTKERVKNDPVFAMSQRIRNLIYVRINAGGYTKKSKSQDILGCSWEEFKRHIERQFLKGMNWDNRGEWHLDHIQPIASAKTEEDVIALNHFTNVRPLWATENIRKSDTITHLI